MCEWCKEVEHKENEKHHNKTNIQKLGYPNVKDWEVVRDNRGVILLLRRSGQMQRGNYHSLKYRMAFIDKKATIQLLNYKEAVKEAKG